MPRYMFKVFSLFIVGVALLPLPPEGKEGGYYNQVRLFVCLFVHMNTSNSKSIHLIGMQFSHKVRSVCELGSSLR